MSEQNQEQQVIEEVTRRAATDGTFRQQLLADPRGTIATLIGQPFPEHVKIKFVEKDAGYDAVIVLPDYVAGASELSAEELEAVAGGVTADATAASCWVSSCVGTSCTLLSVG